MAHQNVIEIFPPILDMINDSDLDGNKVLDFEEFLFMMEKKVTTKIIGSDETR